MSICTKCKIEKPSTEYQSYWHSTQKTTRTRKVCTSCYYEQKKQYRLNKKMLAQITINPDFLYGNDPNYRKCCSCSIWKTMDQYYKSKLNKIFYKCNECIKINRKEKKEIKIEEYGGSISFKTEPNQYVDEHQRNSVFKIMLVMGYTFNEEKGIWFKEPWKTKDGEFTFIKSNKNKKIITLEDTDKIINLRKTKKTIVEISNELKISYTRIWKILKNQNI